MATGVLEFGAEGCPTTVVRVKGPDGSEVMGDDVNFGDWVSQLRQVGMLGVPLRPAATTLMKFTANDTANVACYEKAAKRARERQAGRRIGLMDLAKNVLQSDKRPSAPTDAAPLRPLGFSDPMTAIDELVGCLEEAAGKEKAKAAETIQAIARGVGGKKAAEAKKAAASKVQRIARGFGGRKAAERAAEKAAAERVEEAKKVQARKAENKAKAETEAKKAKEAADAGEAEGTRDPGQDGEGLRPT